MRRTGILKNYHWVEDDDLWLAELIDEIKSTLMGTRAVNTSFDSGVLGSEKFKLTAKDLENGWTSINNRAVSPVVSEESLKSFLYTDGYDEWYFFKEVPVKFDAVAFCNYYGVSLAQAGELNFEGGCDLATALTNYKPVAVVGWNNEFSYCLREKS